MTRRFWSIRKDITGTTREVHLIIYDTPRTLRAAATRWANATEHHKPTRFDHTVGVVHGFQRFKVEADGTTTEHPLAAIIRLTRTHLTPLVIAHEVAHAAQHIYGLDHADDQPVTEHMHSGNEDFAHLYGELFNAVWTCTQQTTDPNEPTDPPKG